MIQPAIDIIRQELRNNGIDAELGNISEIIGDINNNPAGHDVIISLINIEENRISKDPNNFKRKNGGIILKNPAVHLYLTLLFTSVRKTAAYEMAMLDLQKVISVFQQKYVFDQSNTNAWNANIEKLILDMVSLNLQQLHEIWSVLGGRYYPSVVYRMRMVTIDNQSELAGPMITEIETDYLSYGS